MLTHDRRSLVPSPTLPDFGRTGRKGTTRHSLPPAVLPPLTSALSRRAALFGAMTVAGVSATALPAKAEAAALSVNDARLIALADAAEALERACDAHSAARRGRRSTSEEEDDFGDLCSGFLPIEEEMAETPADSMVGVIAKARALQVPTVASCQNGIGDSLAADLVRLQVEGALS